MMATRNNLLFSVFGICILTFLGRFASGQVLCKDMSLSKGDRNLQVGIVIEITKEKALPKLVKWAKLMVDRISHEQPAATFALTSFADYPGKHGSDPEGCYTFHHKLTNDKEAIKKKMDELKVTQYDDHEHSSLSAGISFTAGDKRIGWDRTSAAYMPIIAFTSSKDSQLDNATSAHREWAKGDGTDTCVKNKGCRDEGGHGSIYELIRTRAKLSSVNVFVAQEYALTFRSIKRQIVRNIMTERLSWIHTCPPNPPALLKGLDDPVFETECIDNKKYMSKALVIIFSQYIQEVCNAEFNKVMQYKLKPYP